MLLRCAGALALGLFLQACDDAGKTLTEPPVPRVAVRSSRSNFVGVFQAATATWTLRLQRPGWNEPEGERSFVFGAPGDTPVVGDWNGDGQQTPGVFREGMWSLSDVLDANANPSTLRFGGPGDLPVVGDWDGDGITTVGVFKDGSFSLRHDREGEPDVPLTFGEPGDLPIAGDWDGDGDDSIGVYRPTTGTFVLYDDYARDITVELGVKMAQPIVGD
jgi:hypothetical protein